MKCNECSSRYKGYWASAPEAYACVDVEKPFEIVDVNAECVKHQYEPVKHAHWEIDCDGYYPYCSNCRHEPDDGIMAEFCPNCGAMMDEYRKETEEFYAHY